MDRARPVPIGLIILAAASCAPPVTPTPLPSASERHRLEADSVDYPRGPVRLIEPFGAGGGPDIIARLISPTLAGLLGQPIVVANHPGAGATAAPALVAKSPPDGLTLLVNTNAQVYAAVLRKGLTYDPLKDFVPVAALTSQPYVLVAGRGQPFRTLAELIAAAKRSPGRLRFGSTGVGTGTHLGVEKLNLAAGIQSVHVPPAPGEGVAEVLAATVAGRADYQLAPIDFALPFIRSGDVLALGVTTAQRLPLLPDVPTIAEGGVTDFDFPIWYGVWAPAGTPPSIVARLGRDIASTLAVPEVRAALLKHGARPMSMTRPEFERFVVAERDRAARIATAAGMVPQ